MRVFLGARVMTLSRRDLLAAGAASALAGPALAAEGPSLRELAQAKGIAFGSAVGAGP
ncbi:MAG: glycosyl hydrolase, partial [Caulobacter sp.]